jgi:hypothetical protein
LRKPVDKTKPVTKESNGHMEKRAHTPNRHTKRSKTAANINVPNYNSSSLTYLNTNPEYSGT